MGLLDLDVAGEVPVRVRSHEGGAMEAVNLTLFPILRRMHKYGNFPLSKLSFLFLGFFLVW
jgi:hypothetical protein